MNLLVDNYLAQGCGRCPLVGTPKCKVHTWTEELKRLRAIVLDCDLTEELKWSFPCYTHEKSNVAMISAFKEYCAISFFKGALLRDPNGILELPGENSQSSRLVRFTHVDQIDSMEPHLRAYIAEAIEVERSGLKVDFKAKRELVLPIELESMFEEVVGLQAAFEALTPGRQRGYVLFFTAPKQSKTREARIRKCMPQILEGKGLHD